jgi:ligand-binding SRPBCC domain-containing protein
VTHPSDPKKTDRVSFRRDGRDFVCLAQQWLPRDPDTLFRFFGDCRHLNHVIPPFIRFRLLRPTPPPPVAPGVTYDYRLALHGVPLRWTTRIDKVDAPRCFYDSQARGPYASFTHRHDFLPQDGGTLTRDTITYRPPGGPLAPLINRLFVQPDLRRLFEHRHQRMRALYAEHADPSVLFALRSPSVSAA